MKVVQELNTKGYLIAARGKNGGLYLNGRPKDINIGKLIRDIEQDLAIVECFGEQGCSITPACQLKIAFAEALEAFFKVLDQYSLADLLPTQQKTALIKLLQIH